MVIYLAIKSNVEKSNYTEHLSLYEALTSTLARRGRHNTADVLDRTVKAQSVLLLIDENETLRHVFYKTVV